MSAFRKSRCAICAEFVMPFLYGAKLAREEMIQLKLRNVYIVHITQ